MGGTTSYPEVAAPLSAGGFSDYFERPDYQDEALPIFFENLGNQYAGLYKLSCPQRPELAFSYTWCSVSGRGIPDVSAQALEIPIFFRGQYKRVEGTSVATPVRLPPSVFHAEALSWRTATNIQIVAGVISLLNDYRLSQGKHALGWINPWLYGDGRTGLNDITSGTNPGCGTQGFSAIEGWDPVCPPTDWLSVLTDDVLRR